MNEASSSTTAPRLDRRDRVVCLALAAASLVIGTSYAVLGAGYVLDDWFTLGNARVDGILGTPGHLIFVNRPGAGLLYCLQFGVLGGHPLAGLAILTALSAATAVLVFLLARRFVDRTVATAIAGIWVVLPDHTSLEYWQSCVALSTAVVLTLAGGLLLARSSPSFRHAVIAVGLFTAGALTYEAVLPAAVLLAVAAPALARRRWDWRRAVVSAIPLVPAAVYVVVFRSTQKRASKVAPLQQVAPGHFGWGIVPSGPGATILLVVAMLVIIASLARLALPGFRSETGIGERLIAAGVVVIVVGTLPFAVYLYAPLGAGDRFNLVSAIGGAVAWVGIGAVFWRWRVAVLSAAAVVLTMALIARVQRTDTWTTAAADGKRIVAAVTARYPNPPSAPIVLGPAPIQRTNIAAFLDQSNVLGMLRYEYGVDVQGGIAYSERDFLRFAPEQRFDLRALSELEPDVDLSDNQPVSTSP